MRWKSGRRSSNVEDRRGQTARSGGVGGASALLRFVPMLIGTKVGRIILLVGGVIFIGANMLGVDLLPLLTGGAGKQVVSQPAELTEKDRQMSDFVSVVLADTEDTWNEVFRKLGRTYKEPKLVLFTGRVNSACGMASAAVGPFYCPGDQQLYIDLSFFHDLKTRHGAPSSR